MEQKNVEEIPRFPKLNGRLTDSKSKEHSKPQVGQVQREPHRHITGKLLKTKGKKILRADREQHFPYRDHRHT